MTRLKVLSVEEISLKVAKKELTISASGSVIGNKWSKLKLSVVDEKLPEDKVYNLEFTGENSEGANVVREEDEVLTEIKSELVLKDFPEDLVGVRIHAKENKLEKKIESDEVRVIIIVSIFWLLLMFCYSLVK